MDDKELVERLTTYADKVGRRAEVLRRFADHEAAAGYQATADADADGEEQLAADLRALTSRIAVLREALEEAEAQMSAARSEINRLRAVAKLPAKEPAALNVAIYEIRQALSGEESE